MAPPTHVSIVAIGVLTCKRARSTATSCCLSSSFPVSLPCFSRCVLILAAGALGVITESNTDSCFPVGLCDWPWCVVRIEIVYPRDPQASLDLASHCRLLLHSRPTHRWTLLYPLYILSEAAIIATDLAELIGSAIALVLLFPRLPLWAGVLITASDVFILLALRDPLGGKPVRLFEIIISVLVSSCLPEKNRVSLSHGC